MTEELYGFSLVAFLKDFLPAVLVLIPVVIAIDRVRKVSSKRWIMTCYMAALSGWFIFLGDRWLINGISTKHIGYFFAAIVALGLCRVNVWIGGPLDRRLDQSDVEDDQQESSQDKPET